MGWLPLFGLSGWPSCFLQSKGKKPLVRFFPEVAEAVGEIDAKRFVLDGELVVPAEGGFDFDLLLQRIHPAASA